MLTRPMASRDRKGNSVTIRVPLSQKDVAEWLGCSVHNVQSLETGRGKLTSENVNLIVEQTDINPVWLLMGNPEETPFDTSGHPFTQKTFDEQQKRLGTEKGDAEIQAKLATMGFAESTSLLSLVMLKAHERGKHLGLTGLINDLLRKMLFELGTVTHEDLLAAGCYVRGKHSATEVDLSPIAQTWQVRMREQVRRRKKS
jgi:hypothetical protein